MPTCSSIFSTSVSALRHLVSSFQPPLDSFVFPRTRLQAPVEVWSLGIQAEHRAPSSLVKIEHCASISNPKHDFLIVHVKHYSSWTAAFTLERVSGAAGDDTVLTSSPRIVDYVVVQSSIAKNALSTITQSHIPFETIRTLTFPSTNHGRNPPPTDVQLSVLLLLLAENHAMLSDVHHRDSAWYTGTVFDALKRIFSGREHMQRGKIPDAGCVTAMNSTLGAIVEEYGVAWNAFNEYVKQRETSVDQGQQRADDYRKLGKRRVGKVVQLESLDTK
ncbi:hypothetical protein HETIRDRAFT_108567 [Heterobasidion irregulare TC 32-1]|uniref:Uncharacterized protein n=1 Tax=Heterobasidion irregulare (strain TC 32-1) TaxID=747525 RepID=W4JME8_HETIT|nr:uncharacterized protein HETIRDRAFT_108567 [Heterobasidion irregulare TC 32-1]ETW74703.1 hypothetical protein HETIRDRAFT_108567 [Heterobasidion irregulare TC 32-1]